MKQNCYWHHYRWNLHLLPQCTCTDSPSLGTWSAVWSTLASARRGVAEVWPPLSLLEQNWLEWNAHLINDYPWLLVFRVVLTLTHFSRVGLIIKKAGFCGLKTVFRHFFSKKCILTANCKYNLKNYKMIFVNKVFFVPMTVCPFLVACIYTWGKEIAR